MLEAFIDFKRVYVAEGKKYGAFLRQAIDGHRCIAIDRNNVAASVSHLVAEYARYASFLYKQRKLVIYHFTRMDSLDLATAEKLLSRNERRHELTSAQTSNSLTTQPKVEDYEEMVSLAQRYDIFATPISAAMLMDFRDGKLSTSFSVRNVSRMVFLLKTMERYELIGKISWARLEESGVLINEDGEPINPGYMRRVSAKLYTRDRLEIDYPKERDRKNFGLYDNMASDVRDALGEPPKKKEN